MEECCLAGSVQSKDMAAVVNGAADSVSLSDAEREPSADSEYQQPRGADNDEDSNYSADDSLSGPGRC